MCMVAPGLSEDSYVVGIGASAGGLEALEKFFSNAQPDSGMAYVVIQHLSPDYKSLMADLLSRRTELPVLVAQDGMPVEPNHVYLIPPKQSITIFHRKLFLTERESGLLYLPIDIFFQSLAQDLEEKAIGVILSGTGSDGSRGLRAIKENGGLVIVQDEKSAKFDGMPRSAIATNLVDYILPPEHMAREMLNYVQHPCLISDPAVKRVISHDDDSLSKVFAILRTSSGVDFTYYKQNTMVRRIERRMGIKQIDKLSDYLHFLYQTPSEVNTLFREFLIGVTRFFRDTEAFEEVKKSVIPSIFANKHRGDTIRVWVAACSTGEEAYSIAILLTEYMETTGHHMDIKVFATDLDKNALEFAGKGIYPESIAEDVSPDYLQNYFVKSGESYCVSRRVREMVIFAQQNIITDPPFSKVDLISCRNVLIYLQPILQKKVISAFQFGLNPDGYLFLGTSETIGDSDDFFQNRHVKWKIYQYKGGFRPSLEDNHLARVPMSIQPGLGRRYSHNPAIRDDLRVIEGIQRGVIEAFLHPTVVVDENQDVIYIAGDMDSYLRVSSGGLFSANILKQAREGLSVPLSTAIHKVLKDQQEVTYKNIRLGDTAQASLIDIRVKPFSEPSSRQKMAIIQFIPASQSPSTEYNAAQTFDVNIGAQQRIQDLEHELQFTRESLQATVEELETSNEELQATNEELFASNEELQSTNEELHSVNEELITVNAEYHAKIQELTKLNEDINNLLSSADVGTIFLDRDLRVRLFTPSAQREIHLLEQDIGHPISHVTHKIINCNLAHESHQVLTTLASREMEAQTESGHWYQIKFFPYYTLQQQVGGVVITLMDVTAFKQANMQLARLSAAVEQSPASIVITDTAGNIEYVNPRFTQITGYALEEVMGKNPRILKTNKTPPETYRQLWDTISAGREWHGEFINLRKNGELFYEQASISPILDEKGTITHYLAVKENLTERKRVEEALRESEKRYRLLISSLPDISILLFDRENRYLIAGGEELEKAGFELEKIEGRTLEEAFPQQLVELYAPLYRKALAGESTSFDHTYGDQTYHQIVVPLRNSMGETYAGMLVSHNITNRVNMENTLRLNLEKYQVLFDAFPLGVTIADRDGNILESNREAERILGVTRQDHKPLAIDGDEWKIVRPDNSPMPKGEYASVRALRENRLIDNVQMGIVKKHGQVTWITVTAMPLGDYGVVITYKEVDSLPAVRKGKQ